MVSISQLILERCATQMSRIFSIKAYVNGKRKLFVEKIIDQIE